MSYVKDLDTPLLKLSPHSVHTLRDACAGVHCFGGIGSGKTSSSKHLAGSYLRAGMGGLVLCAKPDEVPLWLGYCKRHGRSNSVFVFDEARGRFNAIDYLLARQGMKGIANVIEAMMRVLEAADHATGTTGHATDPFWGQSVRQILSYALPLLYGGWGNVTVASLIAFVTSAATQSGDQYLDASFVDRSYAAKTLHTVVNAPAVPLPEAECKALLAYWFREFPAIPEKTRGNIVISLSAKLDRLRHGRLAECFGRETQIVPEATFGGAIIIMALPALTANEDGIIGQMLFKFLWMRAVESRNALPRAQWERPVFLWADEAQYFVSAYDESFLSTCRGSRACVVYMTQTLPTYYARLGKDRMDAADSLVGKFSTQLFFQNACNRTNTFASQLIGRDIRMRANHSRSVGTNASRGMNAGANTGSGTSFGTSYGNASMGHNTGSSGSRGNSWGDNVGRGESDNSTWGASEQMDSIIEPNFFATALRSGGPAHGNKVTALWFKAGGNYRDAGGGNFLIPTFRQ